MSSKGTGDGTVEVAAKPFWKSKELQILALTMGISALNYLIDPANKMGIPEEIARWISFLIFIGGMLLMGWFRVSSTGQPITMSFKDNVAKAVPAPKQPHTHE